MTNLSGKVALITGASSGIGAATAATLAAAGVKVGLAARREERLDERCAAIRSSGGEAVALPLDVSDLASARRAAQALIDAFGTIDILVNNAGLMPMSDIDELKVQEWRRMIDVNFGGVLNLTAAVLPTMMERRSGHIVNVSSIAGRKVFRGLTVYGATKHAVTAFSDGLRMEIGKKHNIRVTCIQPGAVATELAEATVGPRRQALEEARREFTFLEGRDIGETILFALGAPPTVDVAELFVLPIDQAW